VSGSPSGTISACGCPLLVSPSRYLQKFRIKSRALSRFLGRGRIRSETILGISKAAETGTWKGTVLTEGVFHDHPTNRAAPRELGKKNRWPIRYARGASGSRRAVYRTMASMSLEARSVQFRHVNSSVIMRSAFCSAVLFHSQPVWHKSSSPISSTIIRTRRRESTGCPFSKPGQWRPIAN